jgi:hypothetical protein
MGGLPAFWVSDFSLGKQSVSCPSSGTFIWNASWKTRDDLFESWESQKKKKKKETSELLLYFGMTSVTQLTEKNGQKMALSSG